MKSCNKLIGLILLSFTFCFSANAVLILNDSQSVGTLTLNEDVLSFYDYNKANVASSDTGLEKLDTFMFFVAEYSEMFYLIGLVDSIGGSEPGKAIITLTDNSSDVGSFLFIDDPNEFKTSGSNFTNITFKWAGGYNDGFIYGLGNSSNLVDLTIDFGQFINLAESSFLSFEDGLQKQTELGNSFTLTRVSAPSTYALFLLGLALMCVRLKTKLA